MTKRISDHLETNIDTSDTDFDADIVSFDRDFKKEDKKHRMRLARLNHFQEYILHPCILILLTVMAALMIECLNVIGMIFDVEACRVSAVRMWNCLSYIGVAVLTYLITLVFTGKNKHR